MKLRSHAELGRTAAAPHGPSASSPTAARGRRCVVVEVRPAEQPLSAEELRRREEELERLIIKAACRRAARLAEQNGNGLVRPNGRARRRSPADRVGATSDGATGR